MSFKESIATFYPISSDVNIDGYVSYKTAPAPRIVYTVDDFPAIINVKCIIGLHLYSKPGLDYHIVIHALDSSGEKANLDKGALISHHKFFDITYVGEDKVSYFLNSYIDHVQVRDAGVYELVAVLYSGDAGDEDSKKVELDSSSSYLHVIKGNHNGG
ncbi:hypothetical protein AB7W42_14855 [Providencia rettgeri]